MKKKILLLSMLAVLSMGTIQAAAAENSEYTFNVYENTITEYVGSGGDIVVPWELEEGYVEVLGTSAIYYNENIISAVLPEGLKVISDYNFYSCSALEELVIPATVAYIGEYSMFSCDNLTSVTFNGEAPVFGDMCLEYASPELVVYVPDDQLEAYQQALPAGINLQPSGQNAVIVDHTAPEEYFEIDASTGTITAYYGYDFYLKIPETIGGTAVKAIGEDVFYMASCPAYRVTIPEGVETIERGAFSQIYNLKWVDFPSTLRTIGENAFCYYQGSEIKFNEGLEEIGINAFESAYLYGAVELPNGLKKIGNEAFLDAGNIMEVYLPESIEYIGENAFVGTYVNYLCFAGEEMPEIAANAFDGLEIADVDINTKASKEQMLSVQSFFEGLGQNTRVWRMQNPEVDYMEDELSEYANGMLTGYNGEMSHIRPKDIIDEMDITGIADGALKGNQVVTYFSVPYNDLFTTIGAEAFADSVLEKVDLFDSVTEIGDGAFRNCVNLKEIVLPESLTSIGAGVFEGCENLEKVTVLCDAEILPDDLFAACTTLSKAPEGIVLPADTSDEKVKSLSENMELAWYQTLLREGEEKREFASMPFEATDAQYFEFDKETGTIIGYTGTAADVIVPREIDGVEVTTIAYSAFNNCRDFTDTDMATDETNWTHLRSVVLPETVTTIEDDAFSYCQQLETFICYGTAESTGKHTFSLCRNLREVIFVNGVGMIDNYAFEGTECFETFYSPLPLQYIGESAFLESGVYSFVVDAEHVGSYVFWNCESLSDLHFTENVKTVDYTVISNCPWLSLICYEGTDLSYIPNDGIAEGLTGYLGIRVAEEIDDANLEKANQTLVWGSGDATLDITKEACDREAVTMPDVEAIIEAYANDPYVAPEMGNYEEPDEEPQSVEAAPVGEAGAPYVGAWKLTEILLGADRYSAADFEMEGMMVVLNEDGTCGLSDDGIHFEISAWYVTEDGRAFFENMPADLTEEGNLAAEDEGIQMIFEPTEVPEMQITNTQPVEEETEADQTEAVESETAQNEETEQAATEETSAGVSSNGAEFLNVKYICTAAETEGVSIDLKMLNGEYSIIFYEDGSTCFIIGGVELPGLYWKADGDELVIDYYGQAEFRFVPEGEGFLLDYMGGMLMTFEKE